MQRWFVALSCALVWACSTPVYVEPYDDEQDEPEDAGVDGRSPFNPVDARTPDAAWFADSQVPWGPVDAAWPDAPAWTPDASAPDAGWFASSCEVYNVPRACPDRFQPGGLCPGELVDLTCPVLSGDGLISWGICTAHSNFWVWGDAGSSRCGWDCDNRLPDRSFFSLSTVDCRRRPVQTCRQDGSRTSQEGVDGLLRGTIRSCGMTNTEELGVTFTEDGCPDWVFSELPRLPQMQLLCLERELGKLRVGCEVPCSVAAPDITF